MKDALKKEGENSELKQKIEELEKQIREEGRMFFEGPVNLTEVTFLDVRKMEAIGECKLVCNYLAYLSIVKEDPEAMCEFGKLFFEWFFRAHFNQKQ